mmetsp:Transcript_55683/g.100121  ORF Transcript_55683/g.100121 Transcript_55683/m.100121 type:complete len:202 (-) Transcript_55683:606-1211(-)
MYHAKLQLVLAKKTKYKTLQSTAKGRVLQPCSCFRRVRADRNSCFATPHGALTLNGLGQCWVMVGRCTPKSRQLHNISCKLQSMLPLWPADVISHNVCLQHPCTEELQPRLAIRGHVAHWKAILPHSPWQRALGSHGPRSVAAHVRFESCMPCVQGSLLDPGTQDSLRLLQFSIVPDTLLKLQLLELEIKLSVPDLSQSRV